MQEVAKIVGLIVDVDQDIDQVDFRELGFNQMLQDSHGIWLVRSFQRGQMELAFFGVYRQSLVLWNPLVDLLGDSLEVIVQASQV